VGQSTSSRLCYHSNGGNALTPALLRESHSAEKRFEARIGAQWIEECLGSDVDEGIVTFLKRLVKKRERTVIIPQTSINNCD
jgi:hypothetical protein